MRIALASLLLISTLAIPAPAVAMTDAPSPVAASATPLAFGICQFFPALPWCR